MCTSYCADHGAEAALAVHVGLVALDDEMKRVATCAVCAQMADVESCRWCLACCCKMRDLVHEQSRLRVRIERLGGTAARSGRVQRTRFRLYLTVRAVRAVHNADASDMTATCCRIDPS